MNRTHKILLSIATITCSGLLFFQNCSEVKFDAVKAESLGSPNPGGGGDPTYQLKVDPAGDYICSPFGSITVPSTQSGLLTEMRYLDQSQGLTNSQMNFINSVDYFIEGDPRFIKTPQSIYLNDVNVPTRLFSQGFSTSSGQTLNDNQGNVLIEYFALKMDSVLKLGPQDLEGYYELATVSDDGTVVQIQQDGQWQTVISNDGPHSTRMGCQTNKIHLLRDSTIPIRIYYNQGPRTEIANVLIWNYRGPDAVTAANVASDTLIHSYCGRASSVNYWTPSTSAPNTWITDVFSEGWRVVGAENFRLPDNQVNPCAYSAIDEINSISGVLSSNTAAKFDFDLKDQASVQVSLFAVDGAGARTLVSTETQSGVTHGTFELNGLDTAIAYKLELILDVPMKQIKVRKEYDLSLKAI